MDCEWSVPKARADLTREEDGQIGYRRLTGDPLALGFDRVADEREWLEACWDAPFPDAPFHLVRPVPRLSHR